MSFLSSLMPPVCFRRISRFTTPIFGLLLLMLGVPIEATPFTVNTLNDSGTGSLREAINQANASGTVDTITFSVSGTITLASTLPAITDAAGLTIDGAGQTITISGNHAVQVMVVNSGATLTLEHLMVANGRAVNHGGGIYNAGTLNLSNCTFSGNSVFSGNSFTNGGGGIVNTGTLNISNSTFSGNSANYGGSIDNAGTLNIRNSTFSGNSATVYGGGSIYNGGTLNLSNSTFSGNSASYGGGIENGGTLNLSNSTFSGNSANFGGGIYNIGTLNLGNTILANSTSGNDCVNSNGTVNPAGVNLVETGDCVNPGPGILTADPKLRPLANHGGSTKTMALLAGSPAIDAADNALCVVDPVNNLDQRGATRPYGLRCDIGAYEYGAIASDLAGTTTAIPTLSEWSLLLLSGLLGLVTVLTLRRSPNRPT